MSLNVRSVVAAGGAAANARIMARLYMIGSWMCGRDRLGFMVQESPVTPEHLLQSAIVRDPGDDLAWLALADRLEEGGHAERAELLRLTRKLRGVAWDATERPAMEARVIELLLRGVEPANPEMTNSFGLRL